VIGNKDLMFFADVQEDGKPCTCFLGSHCLIGWNQSLAEIAIRINFNTIQEIVLLKESDYSELPELVVPSSLETQSLGKQKGGNRNWVMYMYHDVELFDELIVGCLLGLLKRTVRLQVGVC
jgi:hypothetical protein